MASLYDRTTAFLRWVYDSRIATPPVLDPAVYFPGAAAFAANWLAIRQEAMALAANLHKVPRFHELMSEQADISFNDGLDWRVFVLKAYGVEFRKNMEACPALAGLVAANPDVLSAAISFMAPRKHIPPHRGPFRGILRFYLVLSMPLLEDGTPAAALRVADAEHYLNDGEYLLWDDTYEHEVWNRSDRMRAVLLLDVRRHGMPRDLRMLSQAVVWAAALGARVRGVS